LKKSYKRTLQFETRIVKLCISNEDNIKTRPQSQTQSSQGEGRCPGGQRDNVDSDGDDSVDSWAHSMDEIQNVEELLETVANYYA
jgi:hypothetical protein